MAGEENSFVDLVVWLTGALGEGSAFVSTLDTDGFGTRLPGAILDHPDVQAAGAAVGTVGQALTADSLELSTSAGSGDKSQLIASLLKVADDLHRLYVSIDDLIVALNALIDPATMPDANERTLALAFMEAFARRLGDHIVITSIESARPRLALLLKLLGLIEWTRVPADPADPLSQPYVRKSINLHALKDLFSHPVQHLIDSIGWGSTSFDPTDFFLIVESLYDSEDSITAGIVNGDPFLEKGILRLRRDSTLSPPGLSLELRTTIDRESKGRVNLTDVWGLGIETDLKFSGGVSASLTPPLTVRLSADTGVASGKFRFYVDRNDAARPFAIVGGNDLLSVTADNISLGIVLDAQFDPGTGQVSLEPLFYSDVTALKIGLGTKDADSFIGGLLGSANIQGQFDLGLEWLAGSGLRVKASGGIEIALPVHTQIGPIEFDTVYLSLRIRDDGTLAQEISASLTGVLGPLKASVDKVGLVFNLRAPQGTNSRFGPVDIDLGFKSPNGVGLSIDSGAVKGGGYLFFDPEKGEYAGALELTVSNFLSLKAIGLIDTKLPGGQPGFSLLVIITAEFNPGYQLGYGFVLLGVGGLLGLNRTLVLDPLLQGVRTGAVNSILFPTNVVANAPKILSDLRTFFPPQLGTFLIGPMAKIGWGTPTLISVSLGVMIEIPGDVVILGRLRVALPKDDPAVLILQVSFVGALEFDKKRIWFFATLYESRLLFITLEGEMGLLMDFSDNPNFVLSVGGFHPRFTPPPLPFPSLKRITLSLVNESWARVRAETYFAVTSNSVQMGVHGEAFFGFDAFSVEGEYSFDALLRFSPVYLIVEISSGFSVKVFGVGVFGVHLTGTLEGPAPWHIRGSAEIDLFFFSLSVDVDVTFGVSLADLLLPIAVLPQLLAEFEKLESWRATLPPSGQLFVSLRNLGSAGVLVLHPVGTLEISQRFVPLGLPLDKVGNQKPSDVKSVTVGVQAGALAVKGPTREKFASAQYIDMDDAAKLSAPAYEPLESGVELGASGLPWATGPLAQRNVRYEMIIIDTAFERFQTRFFKFWDGLFVHFRGGSSVSRSPVSLSSQRRLQPFPGRIVLGEQQYTVAFQSDNRPHAANATFMSFAEASAHMDEAARLDPSLTDTIHVIPWTEVNRAA
jgi:hypothetical protein